MKVFRENGYFMLILANGHHGVLQSFVKHLSVAVIFLQSCPLARAISRRRKKNMETIIESSFLPPSTADSNWRVEKDRLLLIKAVISSQPNIGWCCREKSTSIVISIRLKNVSRILFFPPPIISIFDVFQKRSEAFMFRFASSSCITRWYWKSEVMVVFVIRILYFLFSVIGQDEVKYSFR